MRKFKNKIEKGRMSKTAKFGGKRGCLCADYKTYHQKCCNGSLWAQGIGRG